MCTVKELMSSLCEVDMCRCQNLSTDLLYYCPSTYLSMYETEIEPAAPSVLLCYIQQIYV